MVGRREAVKFFDTNALLGDINAIDCKIYLSSVTLQELENIKTSGRKDEGVKFAARVATRYLNENEDKYECIIVEDKHYKLLKKLKLNDSPDNLIMACAYLFDKKCTFVTNDMCCYNVAKSVFGLKVEKTNDVILDDAYSGYKEITLHKDEMAEFELNLENKDYEMLINEYLIIRDADSDDTLGAYKWKGIEDGFKKVTNGRFYSQALGAISAKEAYQSCVFDSMMTNKITMVKGKAGSGKSLLSMAFLLNRLEKHAIDKIIIFCNPTKARGATELGFYKGSQLDKLLQSSIGNFLISKLGDVMEVERMINEGKLVLLPLSDARGYDTGNRAAIYMTECQNSTVDLMKLALQRIGEDSICIIDGDYTSQVDDYQYQGSNNGMKRISEVFRGEDLYGEVELKTIYRSRIADIADKM